MGMGLKPPTSRSTSRRRHLAAPDTSIERRGETQDRQHADLERQEALFGRATTVQCCQKLYCCIEHSRLRLMVRHAFPNDGHGRTRCTDGFETP